MNDTSYVKVMSSKTDAEPFLSENFWATPLGEDRYTIENIPLLSYQLNYKDVVYAPLNEDGRPQIKQIVKRSGNRTVTCGYAEDCDQTLKDQALQLIQDSKYGAEGGFGSLLAISFEPTVTDEEIESLLVKLEDLRHEVFGFNHHGDEPYE